jgi:hypothetical protein
MVGAAQPQKHPHRHLLSAEWLDMAADKGPQEVRAHQPTS